MRPKSKKERKKADGEKGAEVDVTCFVVPSGDND